MFVLPALIIPLVFAFAAFRLYVAGYPLVYVVAAWVFHYGIQPASAPGH